jgi:protease-3
MGSEKYKSPNEYMQFISENGGVTNAYTAAQQTTYLFSINSNKFPDALDRLSSAIKAPLFDGDMVEKEINAVNSEWLLSRQSEPFIRSRSAAMTGNPNHPRTLLGVGNKETLSAEKEILLKELKDFYNQYYSSNIMKLVLVGNQSPQKLKRLAKKYFAGIKNKKINRQSIKIPAYLSSNLKINIYIKSKEKSSAIGIEFPIKNNVGDWRKKPNQYLAKILNSQEKNSLMGTLDDEGFIQGGQASFLPDVWGFDGSMFIDLNLTEFGEKNKDDIISMVFNYINAMKENGIKLDHFNELKATNNIAYENYTSLPPLQAALSLTNRIFELEPIHLIEYEYVTEDFDAQLILNVLNQMKPDNVRIYHVGPNEEINTQLQFADGGYRVEQIKASDFTNWEKSKYALLIPAAELIEDDETSSFNALADYKTPQKVYSSDGVQAYLSHTQNFSGKESTLQIGLISELPIVNLENYIASGLLTVMFIQKNRRFYQTVYKRGIALDPSPNDQSNMIFRFYGRSSKQIQYAKQLIQKYSQFAPDERTFKNATKILRDYWEGFDEQDISDQLDWYTDNAIKRPPNLYSKKQILNALNNFQLSDVEVFQKELNQSIFLDIYGHGLFSPDEFKLFASDARDLLGPTTTTDPWHLKDNFNVKTGTSRMKKVTIPRDGIGMVDISIYPEKSLKVFSQFRIINKLLAPTFFNSLRTDQQVGYVVSSYESRIREYPAISMVIISDNTDLQSLKEKIINFQYGFAIALEKISEKTIEGTKKAILDDMNQKPENIYVESGGYVYDWQQGNYLFDTQDQVKKYIANSTKQDLVDLNNSMTFDGKLMNINVQLRGKDFKNSDFFSWTNMNN